LTRQKKEADHPKSNKAMKFLSQSSKDNPVKRKYARYATKLYQQVNYEFTKRIMQSIINVLFLIKKSQQSVKNVTEIINGATHSIDIL